MNSTLPASHTPIIVEMGASANIPREHSSPQELPPVHLIVQKYDGAARLLHWISAAVILWASISGFAIAFKLISPEVSSRVASFNVSVTTIFIPFFILRVWYRARRKPPQHRPSFPDGDARLAAAMHFFIYVVVGVVLASGVLMLNTELKVFNVISFPQMIHDPVALGFFRQIHGIATAVLLGCVILHVLAVIKHEMAGRRIMARML